MEKCDNCDGFLSINYHTLRPVFTTTNYGGKLCGTGCALSYQYKAQHATRIQRWWRSQLFHV